eukprot:TRINITY_DN5161_c0_g6_i1.p1 TRINITY_DN5161_c0_g6~~TRINITY_DN5161_c0_g6_i1.p1  ORF type:complete len:115 (+),score=5.10 TRINITY_DN5161_c0_g6_i1:51-395(+)
MTIFSSCTKTFSELFEPRRPKSCLTGSFVILQPNLEKTSSHVDYKRNVIESDPRNPWRATHRAMEQRPEQKNKKRNSFFVHLQIATKQLCQADPFELIFYFLSIPYSALIPLLP